MSGLPAHYQYRRKSRRHERMDVDRVAGFMQKADEQPLTGYVNGMDASDIEERVARALRRLKWPFRFQVRFQTAGNLPGGEKVVDFVIEVGGLYYPLEVDGFIGHSSSAQQGKDAVRETLLNEAFRKQGVMPLTRIKWHQLASQDEANLVIRRLFG